MMPKAVDLNGVVAAAVGNQEVDFFAIGNQILWEKPDGTPVVVPDNPLRHTFELKETGGTLITADTGLATGQLTGPEWRTDPKRLFFTNDRGIITLPEYHADKPMLFGAIVRFSGTSGARQILARDNPQTDNRFWQFVLLNGKVGITAFNTGNTGNFRGSANNLETNRWYIVIGQLEEGWIQIHINGIEQEWQSVSHIQTKSSTEPITMGARWATGGSGTFSEWLQSDDVAAVAIWLNSLEDHVPALTQKLYAIAADKQITIL